MADETAEKQGKMNTNIYVPDCIDILYHGGESLRQLADKKKKKTKTALKFNRRFQNGDNVSGGTLWSPGKQNDAS